MIPGTTASIKSVMVVYLLFFFVACATPKIDPSSYRVGFLESKTIDEASGLAASRRHPEILWTINDSGDRPVLYALSTKGAYAGKIHIDDAQNRDWEDLAAFRYGKKPYLVVGDVGDNAARRDYCTLYVIEEPDIIGLEVLKKARVKPAWRIDFRYEDGPCDCESIAVDVAARRILLLSKRTEPPVLYALPLFAPNKRSVVVARKLATTPHLKKAGRSSPSPSGLHHLHPYRYQPTGMDISPDNRQAAVLTYQFIYLYQRPKERNWEVVLSGLPKILELPELEQAESICFSVDGRYLFVTSEKCPAPLLKIDPTSFSTH